MTTSVEELGSPPERPIRWRGIVASLLLHAAIIAALLGWWRPSPPLEVALPPIHVVFEGPGAAGAAGGNGGAGETEAATPATAGAPETPPAPANETTAQSETAPTPPPEPAPTEAVSPPVPPETPPPPEPQREAAVVVPPPPLPQHKPTPPHVARPRPQAAQPTPPAPQPMPEAAPAAPPAPPATVAAAAPPPGSRGGVGGTVGTGKGNEGLGHGVAGDGPNDGPGDNYLEALRRWLAKYKQYPDEAVAKKEEGMVVLGFTLARDGTVLSAWIVRSSGFPVIDQAALDMMHRASPVPPVPDHYKGTELKLAMPIDYSIGLFDKLFR
jgi:periplasmic protein TonB